MASKEELKRIHEIVKRSAPQEKNGYSAEDLKKIHDAFEKEIKKQQ
ncbi:hypothetical protein [Gracilibacillus lacisalsi]|nr:hypothetical protein [Gracilibacillus lacisalsi]